MSARIRRAVPPTDNEFPELSAVLTSVLRPLGDSIRVLNASWSETMTPFVQVMLEQNERIRALGAEMASEIRSRLDYARDVLEDRGFPRTENPDEWGHLARITEMPGAHIGVGEYTVRQIFEWALAWDDRQQLLARYVPQSRRTRERTIEEWTSLLDWHRNTVRKRLKAWCDHDSLAGKQGRFWWIDESVLNSEQRARIEKDETKRAEIKKRAGNDKP